MTIPPKSLHSEKVLGRAVKLKVISFLRKALISAREMSAVFQNPVVLNKRSSRWDEPSKVHGPQKAEFMLYLFRAVRVGF